MNSRVNNGNSITINKDTIIFFTDGACKNNQSKNCDICGAGVYVSCLDNKTISKSYSKRITKGETQSFKLQSHYQDKIDPALGTTIESKQTLTFDNCTNNVAELYAVFMSVRLIINMNITNPTIVTDSKYVIGIFRDNNKAAKNTELINFIKFLINRYNLNINWYHIYGHQKTNSVLSDEEKFLINGNNKADAAANIALTLNHNKVVCYTN